MLRKLIQLSVFLACITFATANTTTKVPKQHLFQHVSSYEHGFVASLHAEVLASAGTAHLSLEVNGSALELELEEFSVLADNAQVVVASQGNEQPYTFQQPKCYRGRVVGDPDSFVVLAVAEDLVLGQVTYSEHGTLQTLQINSATDIKHPDGIASDNLVFIQPVDATELDEYTPFCSTEQLEGYEEASEEFVAASIIGAAKGRDIISQSELLEFNIALDCDTDYLSDHGNNVSQAAAYALSLMAGVSAIYERDLNTRIRVSYLRLWVDSDPYSGNNTGSLLPQLRTYWNSNMSHVSRGLTKLLSGINGIGGRAYLNGMCNGNGYSVSGLRNNSTFPSASYVWDLQVTAHELGHNVGANHTHNCNWNPPIDSCYNAEGGCFTGTKARRGTIMSYCHLTQAGISPFFHAKVRTAMRQKLEQDNCVYPALEEHDVDVAILNIEFPINGMKVLVGEKVLPEVSIINTGTEASNSFRLVMSIENQQSEVLSTQTALVPEVPAKESFSVQIGEFTPTTTDTYTVTFELIDLVDDRNTLNNQMTRVFHSVEEIDSGVTLTMPTQSETYEAGDAIRFEWESENVSVVSLTYSIDNGATWHDVTNRVGALAGFYQWNAPSVESDQVLFRIHDRFSSGVTDITEFTSTITTPVDMAIGDVLHPLPNEVVTLPTVPSLQVRNIGSNTATDVAVTLRVMNYDTWTEVYNERIELGEVASSTDRTIEFPELGPSAQGFNNILYFHVSAPGDVNDHNDSVGVHYQAQETLPRQADLIEPFFDETGVDRRPFFRWSEVPEATEYELQVARSENFGFLFIDIRETLTESTFVSSEVELQPETTYYWRVRTGNSAGSSEWTSPSEFTTSSITSVDTEYVSYISAFVSADYTELYVNNNSLEQVEVSVVAMDGSTAVKHTAQPGQSEAQIRTLPSGAYLVVVSGVQIAKFTK